jgi:basic membrane lipoprotein Med (substrate-binding protein (PBP1-ABC) superfamily)
MWLRDMSKLNLKSVLLILLAIVLAAGCGSGPGPAPTETALVEPSRVIPQSTLTATSAPDTVLVAKPSGDEISTSYSISEQIAELAAASGLVVQEIEIETVAEALTPEVRLVILLKPHDGIIELASAHPEIGFIVNGVVENAPDNVYQLRPHKDRFNQSGFLAGYLAALVTPDYRIGGLALAGDGRENAALQGFLNGVVFYCGLCRSVYPPYANYPQSAVVSTTDPSEVLRAIRSLSDQGVTTVYLSPALSNEAVFNAIGTNGLRLIGNVAPIGEPGENWIATVSPDIQAAIGGAWQAWINAETEQVIEAPMVIYDSNPEILSPGKLEFMQTVIDDLASGRIDPAVDPYTGETR